jgi:2-amino-4-hydroxy-6-hydroxymethyldihydropteridine diphosphokinase
MRVVFDLGSNIDREASLANALERLSEHFELRRCSSVYCSVPVGMANQPDYYNISLEVEARQSPEEIRTLLRGIEDAMGRNRAVPKYGPRNIDIDILLYGELVDEERQLPHPQTSEQLFVVMPLAELYPEEKHPVTGQTWAELRRQLLRGRSPQDSGIKLQGPLESLPLGPRAQTALSKAAR